MAVVIRLTATGKKHSISYRIVATDRHNKRDGKIVENLGFYNPNVRVEDGFKIDNDRYQYWLSQGAKASPAVIEIIEGKGVRPPKVKKPKPAPKVEEVTPPTKPEQESEAVSEEIVERKPQTDVNEEPAEKPDENNSEAPAQAESTEQAKEEKEEPKA